MSPVKRPGAVALKRGLDAVQAEVPAKFQHVGSLPADTPRRPRPEKPVRFTLDLDRDHHRFLKTYATDIEAKGAAEVMRALLDELRDDPDLAARVRARVWQGR